MIKSRFFMLFFYFFFIFSVRNMFIINVIKRNIKYISVNMFSIDFFCYFYGNVKNIMFEL